MSKPDTQQVLNRLLTIVYRSLPMYLTYAMPWIHRGDEKAVATLQRIVDSQKQIAQRIAEYIQDHHGSIEMGEYPLDFPDTHDLSLDFLISKLLTCQKKDVSAIERCVSALSADRHAALLAEEALGSARGHLETLEELAGGLAKSGA